MAGNKRRPAMRARESSAKSSGRSLGVKDFTPVRCTGPVDPPVVTREIVVTKVYRELVGQDGLAIDITPALLLGGVPGGTTFWSRCRFEKFSIYRETVTAQTGSDSEAPLTVTVAGTVDTPPVTFTDTGVAGAKLTAIHFRMGLLQRAKWHIPASTAVLFTVNAGPRTGTFVQFTVELSSV